ncbi:methionyl-tRNA formyltransferase [Sphaerochaeta pleomorpha str. Grapes]|uniref:Methionyl-tRNA formyltransferase n=1 Tax=Sphaerochaeta pleomorpha (strain ATCC BAA-1885 / DSM 22778 / Grapes) TaxID=158190 RepID=G8QU22_SPHPG|nr:methionyl-tRNA formyltransferase [Sphaerochaeta pleomorpha]AEV30269.1 methionyl-tRNA formyltransferase [Sphaerochaeta pleomorpha str. Grapes]
MRILFAGTPEIAVPTLRALHQAFGVCAVLTNPDRPGTRGNALVPSPVKVAALELGLPVLQPEHLKSEARDLISSYGCDTLVCFAYGKLFGPKFLSLFSGETLNIHPSLLPLLRGSSPIQGAILNQFFKTGISIQRIASQMDCGDIAATEAFDLVGNETTQSLTDIVKKKAAPLAVETLQKVKDGTVSFTPQNGESSYTQMVTKEMAVIDWSLPAKEIHALIRAMLPWPKATTRFKGQSLLITSVQGILSDAGLEEVPSSVVAGTVVKSQKGKGIAIATGSGLLWVDRMQLEKRKEMDWQSFLNGNRDFIASKLG